MGNTIATIVLISALAVASAAAGTETQPPPPPAQVETPADYVIGPEDVLGIVFWREPEMSGDATVRPDGKISLAVIGEVQAAGLTPEALQAAIMTSARKFITDANIAVVVRAIRSRRVFVTGRVTTPGAHPLVGALSVMQALALAGGVTEYADAKNIAILRSEGGKTQTLKFNYKDVSRGRNLDQNILLKPGDTVIVP